MLTTNTRRNARNRLKSESGGMPAPTRRIFEGLPAYPASYFGLLSNFFHNMDRMFDHTFRHMEFPAFAGAPAFWSMQALQPSIDITSNDNEYTVTAEMPGLEEKDIRLDVSADGMLTISGEKRQESTESRRDTVCAECSYGVFERQITLPEDVDQEGIEARFRNGVLTVTCPRNDFARAESRHIPISSSRGPEEARGASGQGSKKAA